MSMFDMYRSKKKKEVDPNAPPRPNLLNHEKRLKETATTAERLQAQTQELKQRIEALESKITTQTAYLNQLHQYISKTRKN